MVLLEVLPGVSMVKKTTPAPVEPNEPPSETVRVSGDVAEMMREICFHSRDSRGKRVKLSQYLDDLIRARVTKEYAELRKKLEKE